MMIIVIVLMIIIIWIVVIITVDRLDGIDTQVAICFQSIVPIIEEAQDVDIVIIMIIIIMITVKMPVAWPRLDYTMMITLSVFNYQSINNDYNKCLQLRCASPIVGALPWTTGVV